MLLIGVGLLIVSVDAEDKTWGRASAMLGIALAAMALTDINVFGTGSVFWVISLITLAVGFYWIVLALRVTGRTAEGASP